MQIERPPNIWILQVNEIKKKHRTTDIQWKWPKTDPWGQTSTVNANAYTKDQKIWKMNAILRWMARRYHFCRVPETRGSQNPSRHSVEWSPLLLQIPGEYLLCRLLALSCTKTKSDNIATISKPRTLTEDTGSNVLDWPDWTAIVDTWLPDSHRYRQSSQGSNCSGVSEEASGWKDPPCSGTRRYLSA